MNTNTDTPAQCTNSDSWNCKYCAKNTNCDALKDSRNFGKPISQPTPTSAAEGVQSIDTPELPRYLPSVAHPGKMYVLDDGEKADECWIKLADVEAYGKQQYQQGRYDMETAALETYKKDRARWGAAEARVRELEAARMAYASEFPLNEEGEPDVGSVHANIRKLKAALASRSLPTEAVGSAVAAEDIAPWEHRSMGDRRMAFDPAAAIDALKSEELYELRKALNIRCVQECTCGRCGALWLFWPKERSGFEQDTLNLKSPTSCQYCERAPFAGLDKLRRLHDHPLVAAQPVPSKEAVSDGEAELRALLEKYFACYKTGAGLLHWAVNALMDNNPHTRPEAPSAEPVGEKLHVTCGTDCPTPNHPVRPCAKCITIPAASTTEAATLALAEQMLAAITQRPDLGVEGSKRMREDIIHSNDELTCGWEDFKIMAKVALESDSPPAGGGLPPLTSEQVSRIAESHFYAVDSESMDIRLHHFAGAITAAIWASSAALPTEEKGGAK